MSHPCPRVLLDRNTFSINRNRYAIKKPSRDFSLLDFFFLPLTKYDWDISTCPRAPPYNIRHKIKLTSKEIYTLILAKGYSISFTKVKELIKLGKNILKESHLNIIHLPGDAVEFDWGTIRVQIGDKESATTIALAVFSFPYSNYKKAYVFPNCNSESFVTAFKQFVKDLNGVPPTFIFDNMRIARKQSSNSDEVILTSLFNELCKHYQFNVQFCSPHCPNQKGNVENNVGILKKVFEQSYINSFDSFAEVQEFITQTIDELNARKHPRKNDSCENLLRHETNRLLPLPQKKFIYYREKKCKVSKQGLIKFKNNYYSVPEKYKGQKVIAKYNDKIIYFYEDSDEVIAKYSRSHKKDKRKFRIWYMIHKLKHKANGFLQSEEYKSMTKAEKLLLEKVFKNDCHDFLTFIELVKDRPRDFIRKFVFKYHYQLEQVTLNDLMDEIVKV